MAVFPFHLLTYICLVSQFFVIYEFMSLLFILTSTDFATNFFDLKSIDLSSIQFSTRPTSLLEIPVGRLYGIEKFMSRSFQNLFTSEKCLVCIRRAKFFTFIYFKLEKSIMDVVKKHFFPELRDISKGAEKANFVLSMFVT